MKAESEKLLLFRCVELIGMFPFTDKMSQKRGFTRLNPHEKYSDIAKLWYDHWTAKCSLVQRGQEKTGVEEKTHAK